MKRKMMIPIICLSTLLAFSGCGSNGISGQQTGDDALPATEEETGESEGETDEDTDR